MLRWVVPGACRGRRASMLAAGVPT